MSCTGNKLQWPESKSESTIWVPAMKNRIKLCLQVAWLTSAFMVLIMGSNICAVTDDACFDVGGRMLLTMMVLSFPAGFLSVVATLFLFGDARGEYLNDFLLYWLIMLGAGYFQWFVLVPKLFAKPKFTTLGLERNTALEKEPAPEIAPPRAPKTKRVRHIPAYDKLGRTPLERAMSKSTNASA